MKIVYHYYYIIIIIIAWRVTLFSCHASVLGDVYYNSIQRRRLKKEEALILKRGTKSPVVNGSLAFQLNMGGC